MWWWNVVMVRDSQYTGLYTLTQVVCARTSSHGPSPCDSALAIINQGTTLVHSNPMYLSVYMLCVCTRYMVDVDAAGWWPPWLLLFFFFFWPRRRSPSTFFLFTTWPCSCYGLGKRASSVSLSFFPIVNNQRLQSLTFSNNEEYRISQPITFKYRHAMNAIVHLIILHCCNWNKSEKVEEGDAVTVSMKFSTGLVKYKLKLVLPLFHSFLSERDRVCGFDNSVSHTKDRNDLSLSLALDFPLSHKTMTFY